MTKSLLFCDILPVLICLAFIIVDILHVEAFSGIGSSATVRTLPRSLTSVKSLDRIGEDDEDIFRVDDFEESSISRRAAMRSAIVISAAMASSNPLPAIAYPGELITNTEVELDCLKDLPPISDDSIRLYLCRHGQTENNRLRIVQGARVDPPVNVNGKAQATNLGLALERADPKPELFFSSALLRAKMTAEIAANAEIDSYSNSSRNRVVPRQLSALAEIDFGPVADGQPISAVQDKMTQAYTKWAMGDVDYRPEGGGDNGREVRNRSTIMLDIF